MTFRPRVAGPVTGALEVRSNALGSPDTLALLGTTPELRPIIEIEPADTLRFGTVGKGQDGVKPLTIRNKGQGELRVALESERQAEFSPEKDTLIIQAGLLKQVAIHFQPTQTGTRTARLTVRSNDPERERLDLVMRGVSGSLRFDPVSLDFGDVAIGAQKDTTVFLVNETPDAATFRLEILGIGFSSNPSRTIAVDAGERKPIRISFSPVVAAPFLATLQVVDQNLLLSLSGKGVDVKIKPPTGLKAVVDVARVNLTWNLNSETGLSYYVIYRNRQDSQADSIGRASRSSPRFTDTPPAGGDTFFYSVVAVDNQGNRSEPSETESAQTVALPTASEDTLFFDEVTVGSPKQANVIVTNPGPGIMNITSAQPTGRDGSQFSVLPRTATVPAGQTQTLTVTFKPTSAGAKTGTLRIAHDKGSPLVVALVGTGASAALTASTNSLDWGSAEVGTETPLPVTLNNNGTASLRVNARWVGDQASFRLATTGAITVLAREAIEVKVLFTPRSAGTKNATLVFTSASGSDSVKVALRGTATEPVELRASPTSLSMASTEVGRTSAARQVQITTTSRTEVQVALSREGANSGEFSTDLQTGVVSSSRPLTVSVSFAPTSAGSKSASLVVTAPTGNLVRVSLSGTATEPSAAVELKPNTSSLTLDNTEIGKSSPVRQVQVTTTSVTAVQVTISPSGPNAGEFQVSANQSTASSSRPLTVSVVFSPTSAGAKSATLTISGGGASAQVSLNGTATAAPTETVLDLRPKVLTFATTPAGSTSAPQTIRLINRSNAALSVRVQVTGRDSAMFGLSRAQVPVPASREAEVRVTFSPRTQGAKRASLILTPATGNAFSRIEVALTGTGGAAAGLSVDSVSDNAAKLAAGPESGPSLGENYPNPFNAQTAIQYQIAEAGEVRLTVYDFLGQQVRTLVQEAQAPGIYLVVWDGRDTQGQMLASGMYFCRLEAGPFAAVRRMMLLK